VKNWTWLALMLPAAVLAQDIGRPATMGAPRVPQTHSVEQADARLRQVEKDREAVEQEYAASEQVCYGKFFVNACLDKAKDARRMRLAELRSVEVEANGFKRRQAVELRDRDLEDRAQKDAAEAAHLAAQAKAPKAEADDKPAPAPAAVSLQQRQAQHEARERQRAAREATEAPERTANVAEFERKQAAAAKRQQEIAARLAEKEEKKRRRAEAQQQEQQKRQKQ